jgi:hypothetical protein
MTLQDFLDVMEMKDPEQLLIFHGTKVITIAGDDDIQTLTARQLEKPVVKIKPFGRGITVRID